MKKILLSITILWIFVGCDYIYEEPKDSVKRLDVYYVAPTGDDDNNGSINAPWKNIQKSIDRLNFEATLVLKRGIYNEKIIFSGEENSNILLKGEDGAVLDASNLLVKDQEGIITLQDVHHVYIENIELRSFKTLAGKNITDTPIGILIRGKSHDINITKNNIHNIENLSTCNQSENDCTPAANGIAVYGDTAVSIKNLNFIDNEISNCILSSSEAFTINGNVDGFKIIGNHVHDNNNIGIDIIGYEVDVCNECSLEENRARNGIIKNNRAINNSTNLALGLFNTNPWYEGNASSAAGFYVDGGHHILLEGNSASQNDLGFEFASEHAQRETNEILMLNNYVYNNREVGLSLGGYARSSFGEGGGSANNIRIYNNSFYKNKGWGTEIIFAFRVRNTTLVNNIIYGEDNLSNNFKEEQYSQAFNITWGKNLWWGDEESDTSNVQGKFIIKDPLYLNPIVGNLDLNVSSPAVNVAVVQDDITSWTGDFWEKEFTDSLIPAHGSRDINGDKRFNDELDMGADEVQ